VKGLPIGLQDFSDIVSNNMIYVDKTKFIYDLASSGNKYFFVSRPRRFGKSLTLSVFENLFKGNKELFKDTWIYDKWDFSQTFPVVRINLVDVNTESIENFYADLSDLLFFISQENDIFLESKTLNGKFRELIIKLSRKFNKKVVVLVDEYEKPVLDNITNKDMAKKLRGILRNFYAVLKAQDENLRFVFLTGITKFTKTGIFSSLNNINDISLDKQFSTMFGYTQEELESYFKEYIDVTSKELNIEKSILLDEIKKYYNGFSFDGDKFVYNPFSILQFFQKKEFKNFWFESGSPFFLYQYLKEKKVTYKDLTSYPVSELDFSSHEIEDAPPNIFFAQAGYLTFKKRIYYGFEYEYILDFPNLEVKNGFSKLLLEASYDIPRNYIKEADRNIYLAFSNNNIDMAFDEIKRIISSVPYNLHKKEESYYHSLIYTILASSGLNVKAEEASSTGKSDIVIEFNNRVYIIEIKMDKSAKSALKQIKEKGYFSKYTQKKIILIGLNVNSEKRNIDELLIDEVKM
jgi:hypothetical protein